MRTIDCLDCESVMPIDQATSHFKSHGYRDDEIACLMNLLGIELGEQVDYDPNNIVETARLAELERIRTFWEGYGFQRDIYVDSMTPWARQHALWPK